MSEKLDPPIHPAAGRVSVRDVEPSDEEALQRLMLSNPGYSHRVEGAGPKENAAREVLTALPPSVEWTQKHDLGIWDGALLMAFADVIVGWPNPKQAHIGLLMTDGVREGEGWGRKMHDAVLQMLAEYRTIETLRLSIVDTNADVAEPFWTKMGYQPTGDAVPYASGMVESVARVWARPVVVT